MLSPFHGSDPRLYQIVVLSGLLFYGSLYLHLDIMPMALGVAVCLTLTTQAIATRTWHWRDFEAKSALISALSLTLLTRTDSLLWLGLAAVIAISSKFLIRVNGKHLFNPTNIALVVCLLCTDAVWVSPGQWGQTAFLGLFLGCLGIIVVTRARRADITFTFLAAYGGLSLCRALWLGDPLALVAHQLENGALLIFAFFMISDPKSTPDSRAGRVIFAILVATTALVLRFGYHEPNGLLFALALCAPVVPVLDKIMAGPRYLWRPNSSDEPEVSIGILVPPELVPVRKRTGTSRAQGCARKLIDVSH